MSVDLPVLLRQMVERGASDLYLVEGSPPALRVEGSTSPMASVPQLAAEDTEAMAASLLNEEQRREFSRNSELNLAYSLPGVGRFRVNLFRSLGRVGVVLRQVKEHIPSIEILGLPPGVGSLALLREGLVLITGPTGSGKSTTVASLLYLRNSQRDGHIITIEDPVEFLHWHKRSLVSQREVGIDTESYAAALKNALRQAPDVLFVGELRDAETVSTCLHIADTGHLVLSTLHANNTTQAIERVVNFFPREVTETLFLQLSLILKGIISQRLVPRADGKGRVPAVEILLTTARVQALIRRGELGGLRTAIEEAGQEGLQSFDQHLYELHKSNEITLDTALQFADVPNNLRLRIKGVK